MFEKLSKSRLWWQQRPKYDRVETPSSNSSNSFDERKIDEEDFKELRSSAISTRRNVWGRFIKLSLLCAVFLGIGIGFGYLGRGHLRSASSSHHTESQEDYCTVTPTRREWRTLEPLEKNDYIRAVRCMSYEVSKARGDGFLFDDFPYLRAKEGRRTMKAASFLPWNRYFLHVYERELIETCHYSGRLPYWSWTLDS